MTKNNANYELKVILDKYAQDYAHTAEASRNAFMQSAKGGDMIPMPGRIYGNDYRAQFEEQCRGYQAEAEIYERLSPFADVKNQLLTFGERS